MGKLTDFVKAVWDLRSTPIMDDSFPRKRDIVDLATGRMSSIVNSEYCPRIITLCGSAQFYDDFVIAAREITMAGGIVLMPGVFASSFSWQEIQDTVIEITDEEKESLDTLHLHKIDLSDEILVINVDGYIGDSTKKEIEYAASIGVPVRYAFPQSP